MYDVIIIGAGPAGLVAGLYCGRFRLNTLIIEKINAGGQIVLSPTIENFPGFPSGVSTAELIERIKKQVDEVGVRMVTEGVLEVSAADNSGIPVYTVKTPDNNYQAKTVIIASGAYSKKLAVPGEGEFIGRGVSYCGTCDAPFFKNKEIVVVGGGDRAVEEAIFLAGYASKVTLIHRRQELRASRILEEKARQNPGINFKLDSVIEKITGTNKVEAIKIKNVSSGATEDYSCQGVFIFVGIKPNTDFAKNLLHLDEANFIVTEQDMKTSAKGVFACGDCIKKNLYQVVNACGEAAAAADSAHRYLLNLK
ncbi:MAG: thioredoxin-disulfide reductase [Candidatus Omnitrophota bacterium]